MDAIATQGEVSISVTEGVYHGRYSVNDGLMKVTSADGHQQRPAMGFDGQAEALARMLLFELYLLHQQRRRGR